MAKCIKCNVIHTKYFLVAQASLFERYTVCKSVWMYSYRILVIRCSLLSWEHKVSVSAVQLSDGNLTTRILPGRDETLVRQCFLSDGNISWISGLDVRLVIMRTKNLNQYITSIFAVFRNFTRCKTQTLLSQIWKRVCLLRNLKSSWKVMQNALQYSTSGRRRRILLDRHISMCEVSVGK